MLRGWRLTGGALLLGLLVWVVAASVWTASAQASITVSCATPETTPGTATCPDFVVPANVSSITIEVWGAAGGAGGGFGASCTVTQPSQPGGYVKATYAVSQGDTFHLYVGAKGSDGACGDTGTGGAGGIGGNGDAIGGVGGAGFGAVDANNGGGGGGGGETDVRLVGNALSDRIVVAGGGGGTGGTGAAGGSGGGNPGGHGDDSGGLTAKGGAGATRIAVGVGGSGGAGAGTADGAGGDGSPGSSATGGAGGDGNDSNGAGGGGGGGAGLFGGGGGEAGANTDGGAGGGGGSGWVQGAAAFVSQTGPDAGNSGNGKIVITYAVPPHTRPAGNITATSATLQGYDSNNDTYHFEYGTDTSYGTTTPDATASEPSPPISLDQTVTGLTPATTYHYRIDSADGGHGLDQPFTTLALPQTGSATGVTSTTATLQGTDPNSGESYHFEYGTTTSYGTSTPTATSTGGTLTAAITKLHSGTTYHFRLVGDAGAGADMTFSTLHLPVTLAAVSVTNTGAKLQGFDSNSGTQYHFEWGATSAYGHSTASNASPGDASTLSATLSGLQPGTTYHYRIVDSLAGAGRDSSFTTTTTTGGGGGGGGGGTAKRDLILGLRGPASGTVGKSLRYIATIGNTGTRAVKRTKLKLTFRGGKVKIVTAKRCKGTAKLTCTLPKIAAGHALRVKIVVRESKATVLLVKGIAVTTFTDPTPKNNRASTRTTVK